MARSERSVGMGELSDRSVGAITPIAGAVVPAVAVAAHGLASGALPATPGLLLTSAFGLLVAVSMPMLVAAVARRRLPLRTLAVAGVLAGAQAGAHLTLTTVDPHAIGHDGQHAAIMLGAHLVAVPASAALIAVVVGLFDVLHYRLRLLAPYGGREFQHRQRLGARRSWAAQAAGLFGAGGERAPPVT